MTFSEAKNFKERRLAEIGKINESGFVVSDIIIVPSDKERQKLFMLNYSRNKNLSEENLDIDEDYEVWAVDLEHLEVSGHVFYSVLAQ